MKLYLASFLEAHNFGPGRLISIANGNKPNHIKCELVFLPLIPSEDITNKYRENSLKDPKNAGKEFVKTFTAQLDSFYEEVMKDSEKENKTPQDLLPFENEDSLLSWERECFTNYRTLVAPYLEKLGYSLEIH